MDKLIFAGLLLFVFLLAYYADKKNKKWLLIIPVCILSLLAGLRAATVGVDTAAYYFAFENGFPNSWQFPEVGFRAISVLLMGILKSPVALMVLYAFITNGLIIVRLWDYKEKSNYSLMVLLYELIFYIETLNIMRQFLAIAIVFYSTKFIDRKKYLIFAMVVLLTTLIHQTALLALLILLVYSWSRISTKKKVLLFIPISIVVAIVSYVVSIYEGGHISNYFSTANQINNFNYTYIYRALIFVLSFAFCSRIIFARRNKNNSTINREVLAPVSAIYGVGLLFSSAGMFYFVMARVGYYYLFYEILYWGCLSKSKTNKYMYTAMIMVFAIYTFVLEFIRNGSLIFPYSIGV